MPRKQKKKSSRRYGKKASEKVQKSMHEFKRGTLKSGRSGKKVTSRKQAIAIGLSQARRAGGKVPPPPRSHATASKAWEPKYGNEPGAWEEGFRYGKEAALHETSTSARDVLRQLRTSARTNFDRGQIAGYEDVWGLTRTKGSEGTPALRQHAVKKSGAQLDREIADALHATSKAPSWEAIAKDYKRRAKAAREAGGKVKIYPDGSILVVPTEGSDEYFYQDWQADEFREGIEYKYPELLMHLSFEDLVLATSQEW